MVIFICSHICTKDVQEKNGGTEARVSGRKSRAGVCRHETGSAELFSRKVSVREICKQTQQRYLPLIP